MASPEHSVIGFTVLGLAALQPLGINFWEMDPLGVNIGTIMMGCGFVTAGILGRTGFDIQKALEGGSNISLGKAIGWFGAGIASSPLVSILWLLLLKSLGIQSDSLTVIGLVVLGFLGSRGVGYLMNVADGMIRNRFGGNAPTPPPAGGT